MVNFDLLLFVVGPILVILTFTVLMLLWYVESERCIKEAYDLLDKTEPFVADLGQFESLEDDLATSVNLITLADLPENISRLPRHKYHHCELTSCVVCENGIVLCEVCGSIDILTTDCPGARLTMDVKGLIEDGLIDYTRKGRWTYL